MGRLQHSQPFSPVSNHIIANRVSKSLFFRRFPEASNLTFGVKASETGSSFGAEWKSLEKEHTVFSKLIHCIASIVENRRCIYSVIRNSTATSLELSVRNTVRHREGPTLGRWIFFWLSAGRSNPDGSETLTYLLISNFCVINEISIQPYRADLEQGKPIYSASTVRFRMGDYRLGHETSPAIEGEDCTGNEYEGTYVSPKFPMLQESTSQTFKLPRPALCIGGVLQIELMGFVQKNMSDDLYYIGVDKVDVFGQNLEESFEVSDDKHEGNWVLTETMPLTDSQVPEHSFILGDN